MFREMRRSDRALSKEEATSVLKEGEYGVLSMTGENGYPHSIPISYAYREGALWFHCAKEGAKLDYLKINPKVTFCVVGDTEVLQEKFSTCFYSVVVFGEVIEAKDNVLESALFYLIEKYSPLFLEEGSQYIQRAKGETAVLKMEISHMTGKARKPKPKAME
jgi:nitroimidazol reductase NimA-like FMN-containing flavoprotein (pyridoxamine 5'-phosphate oxidase superfamily)